ncbi:MAG: YqjD family protein [Paracoccus sp. (in: a-proteobacteria)]
MTENDHPQKKLKTATREAAEKVQDAGQKARDLGREYAGISRDEARRLYRKSQYGAGELATQAEEYYAELSETVRRKPAQSLGIAVGVGFLIGLLVARR